MTTRKRSYPLENAGAGGLILGAAPFSYPFGFWTRGENVRFIERDARSSETELAILYGLKTPPYGIYSAISNDSVGLLYCGLNEVYIYKDGIHTNITRESGNYAATELLRWSGVARGQRFYLNNGIDVPQFWSAVDPAVKLLDLANWPSTHRCANLKAFGRYLIALDITINGENYPNLIMWSHPYNSDVPTPSWDETDTTKLAGNAEVGDSSSGPVLTCEVLRGNNYLYLSNRVWRMSPAALPDVFSINEIEDFRFGPLNRKCVAMMPDGGYHVIATGEDLIVHNGVTSESLLAGRHDLRKWLRTNANYNRIDSFQLITNFSERCLMMLFPEGSSTLANKALLWQNKDNTLSVIDIPETSAATNGLLGSALSAGSWDDDTETWDEDSSPWNTPGNISWDEVQDTWEDATYPWDLGVGLVSLSKVLSCDPNTQIVYSLLANPAAKAGGYIERHSIPLFEDRVEATARYFVRKVWPKATGGPFNIRIGLQDFTDGPITWSEEQTFDPSSSRGVDIFRSGSYISIQIKTAGTKPWTLQGLVVERTVIGS